MNFWHQIDEVLDLKIKTLLEVGKGGGLVSEQLKKSGLEVTTCDIDKNTNPDVLGSVTDLPFNDKEFDAILAAEILEHLPYNEVPKALSEIRRVSNKFAVISLPYRGTRIFFNLKIPKIPNIKIFIPIPYFWKNHHLTGSGHHWEVGKSNYPRKKIRNLFKDNRFKIRREKIFYDDYDRIFFILEILP